MHDIVIRGGTIIDGTGQAAFTGDVAVMGGLRTDVAVTVFISDPTEYDGGELVIELGAGQVHNKLPAGDGCGERALRLKSSMLQQ